MQIHRKIGPRLQRPRFAHMMASLVLLGLAGSMWSSTANAQQRERTGQEVVATGCASCHEKGVNGAPRIGDKAAWAPRASQGLTALSEHALKGIRNMPAHGGNPGLSDIEVERAIAYMVNQSGGNWAEPSGGATPAVARSGAKIVQTQCSKCHQDGLNGAPKIGDRAAWTPRMKKGLDALVSSAVHGHGPMPARGGLADLSDLEIRGAVVYMFNADIVAAPTPPPATPARADPYRQTIAGTDIHLGIVRADALPAQQRQTGAPSGKGYYHLNISLFDSKTKAAIGDAQITVKVADPMGVESKTLEAISANNMVSFGGYFRMPGPEPYTITAQIQRPGVAGVTEAKFQYKVR